jgi:magnesium transporter
VARSAATSAPAPAQAQEADAKRPAARDAARDEQDAGQDGGRVRARRFDADRSDEVLELDEALGSPPSERQLLWIDVTGQMPEGLVARLTKVFSLDDTTAEALEGAGTEPVLTVHGSYLHVRVAAEPDAEHPRDTPWLAVVAAPNAVVTLHERPITFLDDLDDQVQADAAYGLLDSQSFLATLLHVTVTSYHGAIDRIEDDIERLDDRSLRDRGGRRMLNELVEVRSRIASLRRLLAKHRYVYGALSGVVLGDPETEASPGNLALSDVAKAYADAMIAVEGARELVLGSFNVYATRTAQRTNDTMKVLTLVTVLLLPGSMIAGLLGMNVIVPLDKDNPLSFWFVVAGVGLLAVLILTIARRRRWM